MFETYDQLEAKLGCKGVIASEEYQDAFLRVVDDRSYWITTVNKCEFLMRETEDSLRLLLSQCVGE